VTQVGLVGATALGSVLILEVGQVDLVQLLDLGIERNMRLEVYENIGMRLEVYEVSGI
jgi:hypothetical protein